MKYIITGDCNGLRYYAQFVTPTMFVWNGLINNATVFSDIESAQKAVGELIGRSKLIMNIRDENGNDIYKPQLPPKPEEPKPGDKLIIVPEPPPKVNFDALDNFFKKHILFKQPLFWK